jgi:hypothetical protein
LTGRRHNGAPFSMIEFRSGFRFVGHGLPP